MAQGFDVRGAVPATLKALYGDDLKDVWNPEDVILNMVAKPMFNAVNPTVPATISYDGQPATPEEVADFIMRTLGTNYNRDAELAANELFSKTLDHYTYSDRTRASQVYVGQEAQSLGLPAASDMIHYQTHTDVIPSAKEFLLGNEPIEKFFVSLAYTFQPDTLGFWCLDEPTFELFKNFIIIEAIRRDADLNPDCKLAVQNIAQLKLDEVLVGVMLRAKGAEDDGNQPGTFARFFVSCAMDFAKANPKVFGIMPFELSQLACPCSVVFANVDAHAHAMNPDIQSAWTDVKKAVANRQTVLSQNQIQNLTAPQQAARKAKQKAEKADADSNRDADSIRRREMRFKRKQPKAVDLVKAVKKRMDKMATVARSENSFKMVKSTFMRPNRRDPDNLNLQGKMVSTKYKPDIHLYIDTSGSISEENYQAAVMACIRLAVKFNVNLYFNSFSHVMSSCVKLNTKNKTAKQIYQQFSRVQKVGGGTDYEQIWTYINASKKRRREFSLIITDFEWRVPSGHKVHPTNLHYFPTASRSSYDWDYLVRSAKEFATDMLHIDPKIRQKMLF